MTKPWWYEYKGTCWICGQAVSGSDNDVTRDDDYDTFVHISCLEREGVSNIHEYEAKCYEKTLASKLREIGSIEHLRHVVSYYLHHTHGYGSEVEPIVQADDVPFMTYLLTYTTRRYGPTRVYYSEQDGWIYELELKTNIWSRFMIWEIEDILSCPTSFSTGVLITMPHNVRPLSLVTDTLQS